jgi:threonine dehydratase
VSVGRTIADGQQLATPGEKTFPVISALVDDVVTVTDADIARTMRFLFERLKVVVEPSGASALAALMAGHVALEGRRAGVILSGGNVDAARFSTVMAEHAG